MLILTLHRYDGRWGRLHHGNLLACRSHGSCKFYGITPKNERTMLIRAEIWKLRLPNMMCLFQISGNSHFRTLITSCPTRITWECFLKKWPFLVSRWAIPHKLSVTLPVSVLQLIWEELDELVNRNHLSLNRWQLTIDWLTMALVVFGKKKFVRCNSIIFVYS